MRRFFVRMLVMQELKDQTKAQLLREIKKLSRKYAKLKAEFYQHRDKLWNIVEFLPNAIFETDLAGKVIFANAAGLDIFGRTPEDLSKGFSAFDVIVPEEHERLKTGFQRVRSGELYPPTPYTGLKKDGARFPVAIQSSRVMKGGKVVGVRGVIIDITRIQQAADMVQKAKQELENTVAERDHELEVTGEKLARVLEETIMALSSAIEKRDPYTSGHQSRVAKLARAIALKLDLPRDQVKGVYMAALVHDIGKIYIPAEILSKPAKLNRIETEIIKMHPAVGLEILSTIEFPWPIAKIVSQHHERLDGSGYPSGAKENEILLEAKIMAVADVVEAIASHRPYRPALGIDKALEEIELNKGKLYDSRIAQICLKLFQKDGFVF